MVDAEHDGTREPEAQLTLESDEQRLAVAIVNDVVTALRTRFGYDFVTVSIAKVVRADGGGLTCPGASLFDASPVALPGFPSFSRNLRMLADQVDKAFAASGSPEAPTSYAHLVESVGGKRSGG